jgi:hypothetical protein
MLHARPGIFAIPNPWDAGSAKILALLGFEALATTSAGFAFSVGKPDAEGALTRADTLLTHGRSSMPRVSPFAIARAALATMSETCAGDSVGGRGLSRRPSIEDATDADDPIYPFALSVERVVARRASGAPLPFRSC